MLRTDSTSHMSYVNRLDEIQQLSQVAPSSLLQTLQEFREDDALAEIQYGALRRGEAGDTFKARDTFGQWGGRQER